MADDFKYHITVVERERSGKENSYLLVGTAEQLGERLKETLANHLKV